MSSDLLPWIAFNLFVVLMLALDLGVFHRKAHAVHIREALIWTGVWVSLALVFCVGVYFVRGSEPALNFLAGYLIEESLSIDNLFVFLMIFSYFKVPEAYQHRALLWGILGAVAMRAIFIAAGISLIHRFEWVLYLFGAFLVLTAIRMALKADSEMDIERNPVIRILRRTLPVTDRYEGSRFFVRQSGRLFVTPLFVVLVVIDVMDLVFALDSVPAVFGITTDPFIVYTSNVFAILGLRSLYFALAGIMTMFHYLHYGLAGVLAFIGVKMLIADFVHFPVAVALGVVAAIIAVSVVASLLFPAREAGHAPSDPS